MSTSPLVDSLLLTLAYSDIFATPLTNKQLYQRLIGVKSNFNQVNLVLTQLVKQQRLIYLDGYYFFPDRQAILKLHQQRQLVSQLKLQKAKSLAAQIAALPSILAIYLTGSLAVANASPQADIDFLIITKPNQLWTTRFLLNLYLDIRHLRRKPNDQFSEDKLCLNLYLTSQSLALPTVKHNLHSAYELIQFQSLFERQPLQSHFYQANSWFLTYLPNFKFSQPTTNLNFSSKPNPLESILFKLQYVYMKPKITHELIASQFAFFHPQPLNSHILAQLKQRIVRYNIKIWPQLQPLLT